MHGILHLLGFDHEVGAEESIAMAEAERYVLNGLRWKVPPVALPSCMSPSNALSALTLLRGPLPYVLFLIHPHLSTYRVRSGLLQPGSEGVILWWLLL